MKPKQYMSYVARVGCRICARMGYSDTPAEVHHARTGAGIGRRNDDYATIGLCLEHHRGNTGIHGMGRKAWERHWGVTEAELIEETRREVAAIVAREVR